MKKSNRNFKNAAILPRYCYYGNIVVPVRFLRKFLTSYKHAHSFLYPTAVPDAVSDAVFLRLFQRDRMIAMRALLGRLVLPPFYVE